MAQASSISAKTVIRGRIVADGHIEILGHVEGHIEAGGDVTIGDGALVKSDVQGQRVVVAGSVAGNLRGAELVVLESGARVVGDLSAPSVGIRPGALVRGHVEAGGDGSAQRARSARGKTEVRRPLPRAAASRPAIPAAKPSVKTTKAAPAKAPAKAAAKGKAAKKAPPAPVIPRASGPAKKAVAKKRAAPPHGSGPKGPERPPPVTAPAARGKRRTTAKRRSR